MGMGQCPQSGLSGRRAEHQVPVLSVAPKIRPSQVKKAARHADAQTEVRLSSLLVMGMPSMHGPVAPHSSTAELSMANTTPLSRNSVVHCLPSATSRWQPRAIGLMLKRSSNQTFKFRHEWTVGKHPKHSDTSTNQNVSRVNHLTLKEAGYDAHVQVK